MVETAVAQSAEVEATAVAATTGRRADRRHQIVTAQTRHLQLVTHRRRVTTPSVVRTIEVVNEVGLLA